MTTSMKAAYARSAAKEALEMAGAPFRHVTARKVNFQDLTRGEAYVVKVYGATAGPHNAVAKRSTPKGVVLEFPEFPS